MLEHNIKMNLIEMECKGVDLVNLGQDRDQWQGLVNTKFWKLLGWMSNTHPLVSVSNAT
jgi:hypothetical protein